MANLPFSYNIIPWCSNRKKGLLFIWWKRERIYGIFNL